MRKGNVMDLVMLVDACVNGWLGEPFAEMAVIDTNTMEIITKTNRSLLSIDSNIPFSFSLLKIINKPRSGFYKY